MTNDHHCFGLGIINRFYHSREHDELQEEDITPQDVLYLEKLFCRDCMEIRRGASKFKYRAYWSLRNATKNKRKLDVL